LCDEGLLLISRRISSKASRHYINSSAVSAQVLRELSEILIDIHGPYDNQSLVKNSRQRELVDRIGVLEKEKRKVKAAWEHMKKLEDELSEFESESPSPEMIDYLRFQMKEIDDAELTEEDDDELDNQFNLASNANHILSSLNNTTQVLNDDSGSVIEKLSTVLRDMIDLERVDKESGEKFSKTLNGTIAELQELSIDITAYSQKIETNAASFKELETRYSLLRQLRKKYGATVADILSHAEDCRKRLGMIENYDEQREQLKNDVLFAKAVLEKLAEKLSKERCKHAAKIAPKINDCLKKLGFPDSEFKIIRTESELSIHGCDHIAFCFAPNPGEGARELKEIASSGEIARIMLAVKTVLAEVDDIPMLIFDEVDANIGGKVAAQVGLQLKALAQGRQVLCITHQAQVAANARTHFSISKFTRLKRTATSVKTLSRSEQVSELARMLGDDTKSSAAFKHAEDLLQKIA
ncbi:MAG: hypothetical protein HRT89_17835, partial [Lentisphaeria bacterium]|nr:hypothetical protein [Lentisphaeria bacterium]NQZ69919.1 hypothetical protein [Lentisphaeria bacterium]